MGKLRRIPVRYLILAGLCFFFIFFPLIVRAQDTETCQDGDPGQTGKYRILFLSSYTLSDEAVKLEIEGINQALSPDTTEITYEFMDTREFSTDYDLSILYRYLRNKGYRRSDYDCYIAGDDAALKFLLGRSDILRSTPVVYVGVQGADLLQAAAESKFVTGVQENYDYDANLKLVGSLFPKVKRLLFVVDDSGTGRDDAADIRLLKEKHPEYEIEILDMSNIPQKDFEKTLQEAGSDTAIFLMALYLEPDGSVNNMRTRTAYFLKDGKVKAPVFSIPLDLTGEGVVGGITYDCTGSAKLAAQMALRIAKGEKPSDIKPVTDTPSLPCFDKKYLDQFHIPLASLPEGSKVIHNEPGFAEKNRQILILVALLTVTLLSVIFILWNRNAKQNRMLETDEEIFRQTALRAIDYVSVISLGEQMVTLRSGSWNQDKSPVQVNQRTMSVKQICDMLSVRVPESGREEFRRLTAIPEIKKQLEKKAQYLVIADFLEENSLRRKQLSFQWLRREAGRMLLFQTDITQSMEEERERSEKLRDAALSAQKANEAKTNFLSRISHDIRTPIGAILNLTDFAMTDLHEPEKLTDDLEKIATSGRFLLSLINDVLDISKIDNNKVTLSLEPYRFSEYISEIRNIIQPMCSEKGLTYQVDVPDEGSLTAPVILIDKVRLNQITLNLLSNAVKYTPEGGTVVFRAMQEREENGLVLVIFSVKDNGIGMSEAFQKVMFDEFSQEDANPLRSAGTPGTGLGLPIVRRLVDLMGGKITVVSRIAEGTEVEVRLEVSEAAQLQSTGFAEIPDDRLKRISGRILLAEDNEINYRIAERIFEDLGVKVDYAENGQKAVELFSSKPEGYYRAVFMDIQMPVMTGYEATERIRAMQRPDAGSIPIIAMTADAFSDAARKALGCGMDHFITKPMKQEQIRRILLEI